MIKFILTIIVILAFLTCALVSTLLQAGVVVGRLLAEVIRDRHQSSLEAWSQRSGGRAARAEHDENATVLA